ncbi:MAG: hypothetical protein MOGMAGMI_01378 [Candidatus Omnitrophica bacterium]|nr:hypothetical protein [Candidatus Omnitrophota bacterium]
MSTQSNTSRPNLRKERIGVVVSDKMQKTIVVQIRGKARHPKLGKVVDHSRKYKAHDEKNDAKIGDRVKIAETRPLSKDKRWRLVEILERAAERGLKPARATAAA